jgi:predicted phage terminase large subunit-like protein
MQRLMPNGAIIIVMTRWATDDLTGRLLEQTKTGGEEWEVIELPAILPSGRALWPEFWPVEELLAKKANMDARYWASQYMQNPTDEEGALIKREHWRIWDKPNPPKCHYIIQSWDTAFSKNETADYSACTTWGVFATDDAKGNPVNNIILLDAFKDRMQFPELKAVAVKHWRKWKPDAFIVEAKAAGQPLIYELRAQGIPVQEFTPSRGNDKTVRVNSVTDLFASGMVWRPDQRWAEAVAEECAQFPNGKNDDYVDTTTQALLRFRRGGLIKLPSDYKDDAPKPWRRKTAPYGWRARRV